jgi:hypothetical protein
VAGPEDRSEEFFKNVRQGHVFTVKTEVDGSDSERFVVISQTCDIVLSKRPTVILARVVELAGSERANAATATNPRLVPLPCLDNKHFADLCFIEARQKSDLLDLSYKPGIDLGNEQVKRDFSLSITRWLSTTAESSPLFDG